ncbi:TPA: DUF1642 domain-containing protein [Enterococcus faecium]|uniref:DUF1642 domain-containing protein n=1 Tax=Enterococcus faecium TaxID=1352 RepID=UPI00177D7CFC|nr:DUF1642 domain-containing protein [Enterococcus faecium]MBD9800319.1 DUF1642 domain-containing protein [Enterococcus faecium]MBD9805761.1 DUF1642 domain-containing protein [Enterococcus faecium]HAR1441009.1 DUF1642 domain-containing protein [Enterococcus faecium]HAR1462576.1 DUF1642 domain-containing protein [Enterococcus faecium]HAR1465486.1 DUF1642 domain-containing protein [Enterococcus faecium]
MNKQELIERYKTKYAEEPKDWKHPSVNASRQDLFANFIRDLEQLDEPQKSVVPKFVAEWFEDAKDNLETSIFYECVRAMEICKEDRNEFHQWFANSKNNPIETLIRMKDGYEVEKVKKYIVKIGKLYLKEPLGDTSNSTILTTWDKKCAYPFSNFHMADKHAAKFDGAVVEVAEG